MRVPWNSMGVRHDRSTRWRSVRKLKWCATAPRTRCWTFPVEAEVMHPGWDRLCSEGRWSMEVGDGVVRGPEEESGPLPRWTALVVLADSLAMGDTLGLAFGEVAMRDTATTYRLVADTVRFNRADADGDIGSDVAMSEPCRGVALRRGRAPSRVRAGNGHRGWRRRPVPSARLGHRLAFRRRHGGGGRFDLVRGSGERGPRRPSRDVERPGPVDRGFRAAVSDGGRRSASKSAATPSWPVLPVGGSTTNWPAGTSMACLPTAVWRP